jgi:hypothetical protein
LLCVCIVFSVMVQLYHKNNHFQEIDSQITFTSIQKFPVFAQTTYASYYPDSNSIIRKVRNPIITQLGTLHLPNAIKGFFALPLSTTYSPAPGFLYGLVLNNTDNWYTFKNKAILINILFFHLGVLFLFGFLRKITNFSYAALLGSILFLFSYSSHHYTYHLGSTTWIIFSINCWLFFYVKYKDDLRKMSYLSAFLILFNYLIVFFWIAHFMVIGMQNRFKELQKNILKSLPFLFVLFLLIVFLYPPSNSTRGVLPHFKDIPVNLYYIIANSFCFYNNYQLVEIVFISTLIITAIYGILPLWQSSIRNFYSCIFLLVIGLFLTRLLIFSPERQLLFLYFLIMVPFVLGLSKLEQFMQKKKYHSLLMLIPMVLLMYSTIKSNNASTKKHAISGYLQKANLVYNPADVEISNYLTTATIALNRLDTGIVYTYISYTQKAIPYFEERKIDKIAIIKDSVVETNTFFSYNNIYFSNFNRANNLYITTFKKLP